MEYAPDKNAAAGIGLPLSFMHQNRFKGRAAALKALEKCGVPCYSLERKVDELAWFVGGDPDKIRRLQEKLNELGVGNRLTEDGVYGKKTEKAVCEFMETLLHGTVPTLVWTDVLQKKWTGFDVGQTDYGKKHGLNNAFQYGDYPYIRFDPPHGKQKGYFRGKNIPIDYHHVNFGEMKNSNRLYEWIRKRYNHYPLPDKAYQALSDLKRTGKKVRVAGKVLLVAGAALDALELYQAVEADLKDADRKIGKKTYGAAAEIGGSWAGGALGAKAGAMLGVLAGPAAPIAIPILSIAGGIGGAFLGSDLGRWIIDITVTEE